MATAFTCSRLESLSNEILLDIFEYLDAYNLCQALFSLNHRINTLLRSAHLHFISDSTTENVDVWNTLTLCFSQSQIYILSINDSSTFDRRFLSSNNTNLRSIHFHDSNPKHIQTILEHIPDDNQIKCFHFIEKKTSLHIKRPRINVMDLLLVDHGHRFRSLVNLSLSVSRFLSVFPDVSVTFSQLRRLSIKNYGWNKSFSQFLQNNAPHLRSLQVSGCNRISYSCREIHIPNVRELDINYMDHIFSLQNILICFPNLYRLRICWERNQWYSRFNSDFFQKLFEQHLPQLKQFTFDFPQGVDEGIVNILFINEYWLQKRLKMQIIVNKVQSRYPLVKTISSGKQWRFEYFDNV